MKKVLFLQLKGNALGGVWSVNKTLAESFVDIGYDVKVLALRNNQDDVVIESKKIEIDVINKKEVWELPNRRDLIKNIKNFTFLKSLLNYKKAIKKRKKDFLDYSRKIEDYNPDYIIVSHYQLLDSIPENYLNKTIYVQHSSFDYLLKDRNNIKTLKKYDNKIFKLCWLSKSAMNEAKKFGYSNNCFIYNPCTFTNNKKANVLKNKKITVVTRIHSEKRIELMLDIINDVFNNVEDWSFELYGSGDLSEYSKKLLNNNSRIKYMGVTNNAKDVFLKSSITINTSLYEGFSLSLIEAMSCGVPTITFEFGESVAEEVINNSTGYIIKQDDVSTFKDKLLYLINNKDKLSEYSNNSFEYSKKFNINTIVSNWLDLFNEIDS